MVRHKISAQDRKRHAGSKSIIVNQYLLIVRVNLTILSFLGFDIRITPSVDFKEFEEKIKQWCAEAGDDVFYEFKQVSMLQSKLVRSLLMEVVEQD